MNIPAEFYGTYYTFYIGLKQGVDPLYCVNDDCVPTYINETNNNTLVYGMHWDRDEIDFVYESYMTYGVESWGQECFKVNNSRFIQGCHCNEALGLLCQFNCEGKCLNVKH